MTSLNIEEMFKAQQGEQREEALNLPAQIEQKRLELVRAQGKVVMASAGRLTSSSEVGVGKTVEQHPVEETGF